MAVMLYIVATPIGNLEDITSRALRVLSEVDIVVCEDTRVTGKLLHEYGLKKPMLSYNAHASDKRHGEILDALTEEKSAALVSDAGTPGISDPGSRLVALIREKLPEVKIIAIPGPNAAIAALSTSGFPVSEFTFLGFLPHKKGRETLFREIAASSRVVVFYESPHRIMKTLASLRAHLPPTRRIAVARELTKVYEETLVGTVSEIESHFAENPDTVRGEFVVMVEGT